MSLIPLSRTHTFKAVVASALIVATSYADVKLPSLFSDGAVLQRDMPVPVWGTAAPGEEVTVNFAGQDAGTHTDKKGDWHVWLEPLKATDSGDMTVKGNNTVTLSNISVGEVWVCAGQSNMEGYAYHVRDTEDPALFDDLQYPDFRYFRVDKEIPSTISKDAKGNWVEIIPANQRAINNFSAIGLMLGRQLSKDLEVPVGIIQVAWGGSKIEAWMPREVLESRPEFKELLDSWAERAATVPDSFEEFKKRGRAGDTSILVKKVQEIPTRIYNGMLGPVIPYAVRGIVWYQGESNAYQPDPYAAQFVAMIESWRKLWNRPELDFVFVQLPAYRKPTPEPQFKSFWALLREAQEAALDLDNTYMISSIDIGEEDIHPKNKMRLTPRIYRTMQGGVYGKDVTYLNPRFEDVVFEDGKAMVSLQDLQEPLKTKDSGPVQGFALSGDDRKFYWADAKIDGDTLVVSSPKVANPVAVRYAYGENPPNNLVTASGLPVAPFRSDTW